MLQRLTQLRVALLEFFEQPHVLNGDNRLIGKSFEERDLIVCKRAELQFRMTTERSDGRLPSRSNGAAKSAFDSSPDSMALRKIGSDFGAQVGNMD